MNKDMHPSQLSGKLIISSILAFGLSALLFLVCQWVAFYMIKSYVEQPDVVEAHLTQKAARLQDYISENHLALSEVAEVKNWLKKNGLLTIALYYDGNWIYGSREVFPQLTMDSNIEGNYFSKYYTLKFTDGEALALIDDPIRHYYTDYATYFNLFLFFCCFIIIMVHFIRKKVADIKVLAQEIRILEGGDLDYAITVKGNDELAALAYEINEMRKAFILREEYAKRLRDSSNELMAGISHDLRTPLTVLIGYLEVLDGETRPDAQTKFIAKCKDRAFQIKSLINNLFDYFFVSTEAVEHVPLTICTLEEALADFLSEHLFLLRKSGFEVINTLVLPAKKVKINRNMIQRAFDNLYSNMRRYADPLKPVQLEGIMENNNLTIRIQNTSIEAYECLESTGLGIKTCQKIMQMHKGEFCHSYSGNQFIVELIFPLI